MSILDHIFLFTFLFFIMFMITRLPQQFINRNFWGVTFLPIIIYSLVLGCRYGWGVDYPWYKVRIENPFFYQSEDIGFRLINLTLKDLGFNYVGVYIFYSFMFILCAYVLIKNYKDNKYMLALFLPATLIFSTWCIRQGFAHSLAFLSIYFIDKRQWVWLLITCFVTATIHPSTIITIAIIFGVYLLNRKTPISFLYTIPIYVIITLCSEFFNTQITQGINNFIAAISMTGESRLETVYLSRGDTWFGDDAVKDNLKQGYLTLLLSMTFHISTIYLGYIALKYQNVRSIINLYHISIIGMILYRLFFYFEILKRVANPLEMLYFIPLGYGLSVVLKNKKILTKHEVTLSYVCIMSVVVYLTLYWGRFILMSPKCRFVWNIVH